jgi:hypothetical protein
MAWNRTRTDSVGLGERRVAGWSGHGNEPLGFIKGDQPIGCSLLKKLSLRGVRRLPGQLRDLFAFRTECWTEWFCVPDVADSTADREGLSWMRMPMSFTFMQIPKRHDPLITADPHLNLPLMPTNLRSLYFPNIYHGAKSRDSSVSKVTRLWAGRPRFDSRQGRDFCSSPPPPDRLWGPPSLLSNGYKGCYIGGKAAGAWSWPLTSP